MRIKEQRICFSIRNPKSAFRNRSVVFLRDVFQHLLD